MVEGSKKLTFFPMILGNTLNIHQEILRRLSQRLLLTQANAEDNCDVIIAFVPIVSRSGTDIESALQKIQTSRPVILMVLHFTFDENYVAPQSKWNINRNDVIAVDLLCYEDLGLLRSLRNDEAMKAVTDYLISIGGSHNTQQVETSSSPRRCNSLTYCLITFIVVILVAIIICLIIYGKQWPRRILPTMQPNTTINSNITSTSN